MIHSSRCAALLCGLTCLLLQSVGHSAPAKRAKVPASADSGQRSADVKKAQARVRVWKTSDATGVIIQVRLLPEAAVGSTGQVVISDDAQALQFTNYVTVPAGPGKLEVTLLGQLPIRLPVNFSEGDDSTLLVRVRGTEVHARCINDTPVAEEDGASFNVYNLLPGSGGDVQVLLGDAVTAHLTMSGGSSRTGGLKPAVYPVTISGKDNEGKPFRWATEADLKKSRHSTLLIYPDPYGRIRPRLIEDGQPTDSNVKGSSGKTQN